MIPAVADIDTVQRWLTESQRVAVLTGAGISAESGIPVFRGAGGLWQQHRPEELATPEAFARDPRLVWEWYDWRRTRVAAAEPNPGHRALAQLERHVPELTLITQNVDGLHERAGSRRILRLHGDLWTLQCTGCGRQDRNTDVPLNELPPRCRCGALLRPGVVWFGEALPVEVLQQASTAAETAQVFLVVGTSALVQPAASLPFTARAHGAHVVEINPEKTTLSRYADVSFLARAGEFLPRLLQLRH
ncbi:MAG: NAD-dependent deacylase [Gammaproteobacteria bacterium]|nr:MAG: NAD-dependent deacylase [Gammaproteobacteria bacterium]